MEDVIKINDTTVTLTGVINGLQSAVNSSQEMLRAHQLQVIGKYFDEDGSAKIKTITTPKGETLHLPLISLIPHNTLLMDEVELSFEANIDGTEQNPILCNNNEDTLDKVNYNLSFTKPENFTTPEKGNRMLVKIKFKASPPAEGFSKTVDEFDQLIKLNKKET